MEPKIFLIDIGNVLCRFDPARRLDEIAAASGLAAEAVAAAIWQSGFDRECDQGRYGFNAICARLRTILGGQFSDRQLVTLMTSAFSLDEAALPVLDMLRARGSVGTLSDNGPLIERGLEALCGGVFSTLGHPPLYSHCFGATKKQPGLYSRVAERLGTSVERIILVDDSPGNVETARRAGAGAVLFDNWPAVFAALAR